jgi:quercetin dioxygenase-like cupin family protein
MRDAAERASLSRSFISMVEAGTTEIAVSRLLRLAEAYDATVADLLANVHGPSVEFVERANAYEIPTSSDAVRITYLSSPSWSMQPFEVRLAPGAELKDLSHHGEEFITCVVGRPELVVESKTFQLSRGDTVFLPDRAQHAYLNPHRRPAALVGAVQRVTASTF